MGNPVEGGRGSSIRGKFQTNWGSIVIPFLKQMNKVKVTHSSVTAHEQEDTSSADGKQYPSPSTLACVTVGG